MSALPEGVAVHPNGGQGGSLRRFRRQVERLLATTSCSWGQEQSTLDGIGRREAGEDLADDRQVPLGEGVDEAMESSSVAHRWICFPLDPFGVGVWTGRFLADNVHGAPSCGRASKNFLAPGS